MKTFCLLLLIAMEKCNGEYLLVEIDEKKGKFFTISQKVRWLIIISLIKMVMISNFTINSSNSQGVLRSFRCSRVLSWALFSSCCYGKARKTANRLFTIRCCYREMFSRNWAEATLCTSDKRWYIYLDFFICISSSHI